MSSVAERMESSPDVRIIYLHAGQLYASAEASQITTILGSCVALSLWDPVTRVGGINHFMLPQEGGRASETPRFAHFALAELARQMIEFGAVLARAQAKLFGGACTLPSLQTIGRDLGARNAEVARRWLVRENIPLLAEDIGGSNGRKLVFRTDTGIVMVKRIGA